MPPEPLDTRAQAIRDVAGIVLRMLGTMAREITRRLSAQAQLTTRPPVVQEVRPRDLYGRDAHAELHDGALEIYGAGQASVVRRACAALGLPDDSTEADMLAGIATLLRAPAGVWESDHERVTPLAGHEDDVQIDVDLSGCDTRPGTRRARERPVDLERDRVTLPAPRPSSRTDPAFPPPTIPPPPPVPKRR